MCLVLDLKDLKPRKANKDIECYKVVRKKRNHHFYSAYQEDEIKDEYIPNGSPMVAHFRGQPVKTQEFKKDIVRRHPELGYFLVAGGAIHSFVTIEDAQKDLIGWKQMYTSRNKEYVIFKCIIPKGTLYYEGLGNGCLTGMKVFASMSVVYKENVES